ncbi:hypothetical protein BX666DRAFT_2002830 [Dichotomocladium elegans]|nr:hypothetical protein BX666DRAFT_2002830 [Dichotomocladium elegans]
MFLRRFTSATPTAGRSTRYKLQREPLIPRTIRRSPQPQLSYVRPIVFGITACTSVFVVSAIVYDRNQVTFWDRLRKFGLRSSRQTLTIEDYLEERQLWLREKWEQTRQRLERIEFIPRDVARAYLMVVNKLLSLSEAERTIWGLVGMNVLVFGCWQIPRLMPFMTRWFLHDPSVKGRSVTLLTSVFSHQEIFHLSLNMVGLYSFGMVVHEHMGREQFLASYLATGIGANVLSHVLSIASRRFRPIMPSLGASGAIYGLLASTAVLYPNSSVSLIFLPFIPIKMGYALPALMGFDVAGIMLGWRQFDHYAHLAGACLGLSYMSYGEQWLWRPLVDDVHNIRKSMMNK